MDKKYIFLGIILVSGLALAAVNAAESKQSVCNVTPNEQGQYNEEGCKTAFNAIPDNALCKKDEDAVVGSCTVSSEACTNKDGKKGMWCECTYTCKKKQSATGSGF